MNIYIFSRNFAHWQKSKAIEFEGAVVDRDEPLHAGPEG